MSATADSSTPARSRVSVRGTVQGVGFRPYVYRLAHELELGGYVRNDVSGLTVEIEGSGARVDAFLARLAAEAPPLSVVEEVISEALRPTGERGFRIVTSVTLGLPDAAVAPDIATCDDCLAELFDPSDRRFRYPFVNCTNCGPRFTIARGVPYDRPLTTMAGFQMCAECLREYNDPADRRFHAQPNACPACGPRLRLIGHDGRAPAVTGARDAIEAAACALAAGLLVAVKGIGGYHLACDATNESAVSNLRSRKHREERPFALMARDLAAARRLVELAPEEEAALGSGERPIVLAERLPEAAVAHAVAPGSRELGVLLPYTPLHHLLAAEFGALRDGPLVMTSGNLSDEPIAYEDGDALERLAGIADLFLVHDRPIHIRVDDSVVRVVRSGGRRRQLPIRRSRGHVPRSLGLPVGAARPLLGCGAEQKSTFCLARGTRAWVGHHIGDLEHFANLKAFREGIEHFERLFAVEPALVAHDLHPGYLSSAYAHELDGVVELVGVQHHHAHLAACLAELGLEGPAVGAIYDGTGYGADGTIWGGELLVGGLHGFERAGCLWPVRLPGGAQAIREPWRMACAWLAEAFGEPRPLPRSLEGVVDRDRWSRVAEVGRSELVSPATTSMGRLFDAVAALCGISPGASYEGQAAVELEAAAATGERGSYPLPAIGESGAIFLDARETIRSVVGDLEAGVDPGTISARFHLAVAKATASACAALAEAHGLDAVVLSGGVFQNRRLLEAACEQLERLALRPLLPQLLPPNDGGISYGQAAVAACAGERR